jgi:hypothetical protein
MAWRCVSPVRVGGEDLMVSPTPERLLVSVDWWLNVQSGLQDPGNNTSGILQSA